MTDKQLLELEYKQISDSILFRLRNETALIPIWSLIISAILLYGYKQGEYGIFIIAPFAIFFYAIYILHNISERRSLGGYKKYLEEQLFHKDGNGIQLGCEYRIISNRKSGFLASHIVVYNLFFSLPYHCF